MQGFLWEESRENYCVQSTGFTAKKEKQSIEEQVKKYNKSAYNTVCGTIVYFTFTFKQKSFK